MYHIAQRTFRWQRVSLASRYYVDLRHDVDESNTSGLALRLVHIVADKQKQRAHLRRQEVRRGCYAICRE